jgi:hypothetical protein
MLRSCAVEAIWRVVAVMKNLLSTFLDTRSGPTEKDIGLNLERDSIKKVEMLFDDGVKKGHHLGPCRALP